MASKRRIRRKQCSGKIRHKTSQDAKWALFRQKDKFTNWYINVYKCKFCGGYHLGHAPRH